VEPSGWVDIYSPPKFSSDGQQYVMILPVSQGEVGNFKHLTLIDRPTNQLKPLTQGRWEVTEIIGWDEVNNIA
jgi:Dipeptidyl peptidase IV (DPP IV) N-terminal region